ncbi:pyruvate kinase [Pseudalkalibacillus caeni]|uniref:Pyruvate kinase n=1 Tax=Exobacillus caeni TaxID=2574798 RepID=A0A5R9F3I7_9BACL|nr:pyruvate kinase [Pseudalkalibacillus caeni]TLS37601.1 pyruvate kinase [Pseudalkalibacillus caeni]
MSTDIVCTIGPVSNKKDVLLHLAEHGLTIARLNFSHGTHHTHKETIKIIRDINSNTEKNIKILGDLQGPKIRLGEIEEGPVTVQKEQFFTLKVDQSKGSNNEASIDYSGIINDINEDERILINDGSVELKVNRITDDSIETVVLRGGEINSHKGVNFPDTEISLPGMTEKDKNDLQFLLEERVDMIACSFIRRSKHLQEYIDFAKKEKEELPEFIAKVETREGVKNFSSIRNTADGIMVARGDMGVELPYKWVPVIQKAMIDECNKHDTFVITATQMLQSMTESAVPTRAEVTDVFQAVLDGTNGVMLSAESAIGKYPVESVDTLKAVSEFAERVADEEPYDLKDMLHLLENNLY